MPRKNAIIACKGIPNQSKAGTHGMSPTWVPVLFVWVCSPGPAQAK